MAKNMKLGILLLGAVFQLCVCALAQQTLGGITGTVADSSSGVLPETTVTIVGDQTGLTRTQKTNANGAYDFVNLPIVAWALQPPSWACHLPRSPRPFAPATRRRPRAPRSSSAPPTSSSRRPSRCT